MHISKILPAALTLATGALAQSPSVYTLHVNSSTVSVTPELQTSAVSYANSSIWIGNINREIYAEPFSAEVGNGLALIFTSYHAVATGEQTLYIFPNETQPVQFTVPHGGFIPANASAGGFTFDSAKGGYLEWNGENKFWGCENAEDATLESYEIWWFGDVEPNGLTCVGPLDLYADVCSSGN